MSEMQKEDCASIQFLTTFLEEKGIPGYHRRAALQRAHAFGDTFPLKNIIWIMGDLGHAGEFEQRARKVTNGTEKVLTPG